MPAIPYSKTATSDGPWNGPQAMARLKNDKASLRAACAWVDPKGDPNAKGSYKFPYREVAADGSVGPANLKACSAVIAVLNGGRGGANIPASDCQGVYNAVAGHLRDAGQKPPPLGGSSSAATLAARMRG